MCWLCCGVKGGSVICPCHKRDLDEQLELVKLIPLDDDVSESGESGESSSSR